MFIDLLVFTSLQSLDTLFIVFNIFFLLVYSYYRKYLNNFFFISAYFTKNIFFLLIYIIIKIVLLLNFFPLAEFWGTDKYSIDHGDKPVNIISYYYTANLFITYFSGVHCSSLYSLEMQILFSFIGLISLIYFYLYFYYNKNNSIQIIHVFFFSTVIYLLSWIIPFQNLLYIFFTFETLTYLLIGLVAIVPNRFTSEALSKFFIISSISGVLTLFGILQFYILTGSLNLLSLYQFIVIFGSNDSSFISFFIFLIIFSVISKLGVLPISWYVFDLYQASILPITFLLSVTLKVGIFFFINLFFLFLDFYYSKVLYYIFFFLSVFSVIIGCILTFKEYNLNRFLSTNSIMSSGFLLSTLYFSINPYSLNIAGLQYLLAYVVNMILLFYVIIHIVKLENFSYSVNVLSNLNDLKGFSKISLGYSVILTLILFSFIGIPPLIGFVGKFAVLWTLYLYDKSYLLLILIIISILSSFFYLRIVQFIWFYSFDQKLYSYKLVIKTKFLKYISLNCFKVKYNFLIFYNIKFVLISLFSYFIFTLSIILNFTYITFYLYYFYEIHWSFTEFFQNTTNEGWYSSIFSNKDSV